MDAEELGDDVDVVLLDKRDTFVARTAMGRRMRMTFMPCLRGEADARV